MEIIEVDIRKITRDKNQPRNNFDPAAIIDMAKSIKTEGIINPIEVDKDFVIVTGEMRWRSAKKAGLETVPVKVITISSEERFRRQVIENVHHNTMTEEDTAKAVKHLLDDLQPRTARMAKRLQGGGTEIKGTAYLSEMIGKSESWVKDRMDFLKTSNAFRKAVRGGLSPRYMRSINVVPEQFKGPMEEKIINKGFTTTDGAKIVANAIKHYPDSGVDLLNKDYSKLDPRGVYHEVKKLLPEFTETPVASAIEKAFQPSEEIAATINKLKGLLSKYTVADMGGFNIPRIVLGMRSLVTVMDKWLKTAPEKQLK